MFIFVIIATMLSILLLIVSFWLPTMTPYTEKLLPYECGFEPLDSARMPYSLRFFLVSILFLLFDLEIALLLPSPWAAQFINPTVSMFWMTMLMLILTAGLMYEWYMGGLEWAE
uniref:NADH-ubiquinone oxidoreductase chain 3 n=1 Tax=Xenorhina sp. TNHC-GDC 31177 TaxID=1933077 RepID=A0A343VTH5_9NEOB|nr:NADH dehydrogenase subunit 3 [Xenorhina sp. TNHC-GDC 31177]